jgi:hypothetical protein
MHSEVRHGPALVTLGEMKNSEKFRFVADGAERLA